MACQTSLPLSQTLASEMTLFAIDESLSLLMESATEAAADNSGEMPPLPASRAEVENAVAVFAHGSVALLGTQATEAQFKKQPLGRFAIIHLAVHAFSDPKDQAHAALLLAPDESGEEDGFLQPREISQLSITAKLVVLSACNTGAGPSFGQEGIANLARAFLMAGASSVCDYPMECRRHRIERTDDRVLSESPCWPGRSDGTLES